jgi:hypothetical protein
MLFLSFLSGKKPHSALDTSIENLKQSSLKQVRPYLVSFERKAVLSLWYSTEILKPAGGKKLYSALDTSIENLKQAGGKQVRPYLVSFEQKAVLSL